jgi:nitroreductase
LQAKSFVDVVYLSPVCHQGVAVPDHWVMELIDALRTTGAVREFTDRAVDDAVLARVLDTARFAPSGSNAQAWRVVVVKDAANRRRLRDCYLQGSREYLALAAAGLRPWSPTNDREAEAQALGAENVAAPGDFAEHFDEAPVLLALFADLSMLAAIIALGYPVRRPRRLRREPVSSFVTVDSIGGPVFKV